MEHQNNIRKQTVFVDSDAFVALAKEDDANHGKAVALLNKLFNQPVVFLTSNYVFLETVTVISMRVGREPALAFINSIKSPSNGFLVHWIDETLEDKAIEIFKQQTSKNVSFVDCVNMAFMRQNQIDAIFGFDEIYKKNKFQYANSLV